MAEQPEEVKLADEGEETPLVLVTGASGFIASHIVSQLADPLCNKNRAQIHP
ncbi:MAG: hypothetical protein GY737_10045 [Desulfobacteraceae bacterium]|nr:hypothetical protein [Desulfobacteraceae bacterium]